MSNRISVCKKFSFKGQLLSPSSTIDLDECMTRHNGIPSIERILSVENNIDTYSYEYEVMQTVEPTFYDANGMAEAFHCDGRFDQAGFEAHWRKTRVLEQLQVIAQEILGVDDLAGDASLQEALFRAYELNRDL